jgi:hypothetical protein
MLAIKALQLQADDHSPLEAPVTMIVLAAISIRWSVRGQLRPVYKIIIDFKTMHINENRVNFHKSSNDERIKFAPSRNPRIV